MHLFKTQQFLPITIEEAWNFFSTPKNLAKITPPEMDFKIISPLPEGDIYNGMKINYSVKPLMGIPVKWVTMLKDITVGHRFTDIQIKGPYEIWEHTHIFTPVKNGVHMEDIVKYKVPFGFIGRILNSLFIKNKITTIFNYRKNILEKLFTHAVVA